MGAYHLGGLGRTEESTDRERPMVTATRGKVLTLPTAAQSPKWSKPPAQPVPVAIGSCPECGDRVTALVGSPWRKPHLLAAVPCMCWLTVDEGNELENGAWQ